MSGSILTIAGTTVNRPAARVVLNRLTLSLDRPDELEFAELSANLPGSYRPEQAVTLTVDGVLSFSGWIFGRYPDGFGESSGRVGYRCLGLSYGASLLAITAADGTGTMAFNLPVTDPNYVATEAGLSVGTIISQVLNQHSAQLSAMGITTDATTASQLAALTVVSPDPVYISGNSLWTQLQQLLQTWYGSRYALYILPSGPVRCYDTTSLTPETITLDSDPAVLTSMQEDTAECYTQVVLRGRAEVEPAWLSLHDGTLVGEATTGGGWTPTQQSEWSWADYQYPQGGYDQGAITAETSTVVTVKSDTATLTWATNYWDGIQGQIAVINPAATGIAMQEVRHVTACSALSAGGTATITLDRPLTSSGYTRYQLTGVPGGLSYVWRKFAIPNAYLAEHLVEQFNFAVPFTTSQSAVAMTTGPAGVIGFTTGGIALQIPFQFEVVPYDGTNPGYILAYAPVVATNNSQAALNAGGSAVQAPTDVIVLVPYSRGPLTVTSPSSGGYSGTAYSLFGVQRTLYRDYANWIDAGNSSSMQQLADAVLATVSNAIQEGSLVYFDKYTPALISGSWPIALNVAKATGTTGYESMAAPCRTVQLEWPQDGAAVWVTHLQFSTRRQMFSGDRLYVHPMYLEGGPLASAGALEFNAGTIAGAQLGGLQAQAQAMALRQAGGVVDESGQAQSFGKKAGFNPDDLQQGVAERFQAARDRQQAQAQEQAKARQEESQRRARINPWQHAQEGLRSMGIDLGLGDGDGQ